MSRVRTARRSASHGALGSTLVSQDSGSCFRSASQRHNSPMDIRSENSNLFASPGPLESMLKKTTETSDIGVFSIKASPATPAIPLQRPLRSRTNLRDFTSRGSVSSTLSTIIVAQDDRRRLPSFRDNASDITSMQETESRASATSSLQPPYEDGGYRSYSMTSCSSRAPPRQKSNATLQSQASSHALQRPRSPFPYPTRLKRPGVRPASPALTMDGSVDYSRMVALDRVSHVSDAIVRPLSTRVVILLTQWQRTVHGSYRPPVPTLQRRPFPAARLRGMSESSSAIYPSRSCQFRPDHGRAHPRSGLAYQDQGFGPFGHGRRASTFTSTAEGVRRRISQMAYQRTPPREKALYYDYSEAFDGQTDQVNDLDMSDGPYAPVPTRTGYLNRPSVLEDDYIARFEGRRSASAFEMRPVHSPAQSSRLSISDDLPEGQAPAYGRRFVQNQARMATAEVPRPESRTSIACADETFRSCAQSSAKDMQAGGEKQFEHVPDASPQPSDHASSLAMRAETSSMSPDRGSVEEHEETYHDAQHAVNSSTSVPQLGRQAQVPGKRPQSGDREKPNPPHGPLPLRLHIPPHSLRTMSPSARPESINPREGDELGADRDANAAPATPMHAPQPISPIRESKLRNSICHLMKALPPLPGSEDFLETAGPTRVSVDDQFPVQFSPFSLKRLSTPQSERRLGHSTSLTAGLAAIRQVGERIISGTGASCSGSEMELDDAHQRPSRLGSPGFDRDDRGLLSPRRRNENRIQPSPLRKLKLTRPALTEAFRSATSADPENSDAGSHSPAVPFQPEQRPRQVGTQFASGTAARMPLAEAPDTAKRSCPQQALAPKQDRPDLMEVQGAVSSHSPSPRVSVEAPSQSSQASAGEPANRLRKRFSHLKMRSGHPRIRQTRPRPAPAPAPVCEPEHTGLSGNPLAEKQFISLDPIPEPMASVDLSVRERGVFRQKLTRWAKSVREAMTTYTRRKTSVA
jgi:hypothetical protein